MSNNLDKINFSKIDPENMIGMIENFPQLCRNAWNEAKKFSIPSYYIKAKKIVVCGMGASGISGDILKDFLQKNKDVIIESIHDYMLPGWVDKETLVIITSFSGNTEEALANFYEASEKNAKIFVVTTGGKLKIVAEKYRVPLFVFNLNCQPRAAFPYLFSALTSIFTRLGYLSLSDDSFLKTVSFLEDFISKIKSTNLKNANQAKILAEHLRDKNIVIFASGILKSVARRFKMQINENAKQFSFVEFFPELNHNTVEGLSVPKNSNAIICLESNFDTKEIIKRQNITSVICAKKNILFERIKFVPCDSEMSEVLMMVVFGDFLSYYLAVLNNEDPTPVKTISFLKLELEK